MTQIRRLCQTRSRDGERIGSGVGVRVDARRKLASLPRKDG